MKTERKVAEVRHECKCIVTCVKPSLHTENKKYARTQREIERERERQALSILSNTNTLWERERARERERETLSYKTNSTSKELQQKGGKERNRWRGGDFGG